MVGLIVNLCDKYIILNFLKFKIVGEIFDE